MAKDKVFVLGAGFLGVCVALGLCRRGYPVTLIDQAEDCMLRASLRNEGKIHLGFVYANDPSFRTSSLMLRAAMHFAGLVENWVGAEINWDAFKSHPFTYAIAHDSMVAPEKIVAHYEKIQNQYRAIIGESDRGYLGDRAKELWRALPKGTMNHLVSPGFSEQFVSTTEVAIDRVAFRQILCAALNKTGEIKQLYRHQVESVSRTSSGFRVEGTNANNEMWSDDAGLVINCLWNGRLSLDQKMGIVPSRKWAYRLKYRLLGKIPANLAQIPSFTFVLGSYGDLVTYPNNHTYISWYPTCMKGWCDELATPPEWNGPASGHVSQQIAVNIERETLAEFGKVIPGLEASRIDTVDAGVIFSWGESDIDHPESQLHERFDVGVQEYDGYFSIDTGKFTCAPYFAQQLLDRIE